MTPDEMRSDENINKLAAKPFLELKVRIEILRKIELEYLGDPRLDQPGGVRDQLEVLALAVERKLTQPVDQVVGLKTLEMKSIRG